MDGPSSARGPERELPDLRASRHGPVLGRGPEGTPTTARHPRESARAGRLPSLWRRITATRRRRIAAVVAALAVLGGLVGIVASVVAGSGPRPDAILQRTATEADGLVRDLAREPSWLEIDVSTLRAHESYLGIELWSAQNAFHSPCLLAVGRETGNLHDVDCVPPPAELFIDVSSDGDEFTGFPGDGIIRFVLRGDTVEVHMFYLRRADG